MISKREQNKRDTNDRLLSAARILFSAQGFASTTVDDIAERAEVSRATFFNYFQGKDSVLEALHSDHLDQLAALVDQLMESPMRLLIGSPGFFSGFCAASDHASALSAHGDCRTRARLRLLRSGGGPRSSVPRGLLRIVTAGIEAGEVRSDYPPLFLAQMIGGTYGALVRFWRQDADYDVVGEFDRGARYVAEGIAAR